MKKERGRKMMQGTTITQGKAHSGSWLPKRIPYKYLRMLILIISSMSKQASHPKFGVKA